MSHAQERAITALRQDQKTLGNTLWNDRRAIVEALKLLESGEPEQAAAALRAHAEREFAPWLRMEGMEVARA